MMDGGVVGFGGRRTPIEIDDGATGLPRAWVAFLLALLAGAGTLLFIVLTVVPLRGAGAGEPSVTEFVLRQEPAQLRAGATPPVAAPGPR